MDSPLVTASRNADSRPTAPGRQPLSVGRCVGGSQSDKSVSWRLSQGLSVSPRAADRLLTKWVWQAELRVPKNYPMSPPQFTFTRPLFHPNIYKDGKLCISILHSPGHDEMSGELAAVRLSSTRKRICRRLNEMGWPWGAGAIDLQERWSAAQRIFTVLISILSLLDDGEVSSAANVDAAVMLRKDPENYRRIVKENVEASKRDIPPDFRMPTEIENKPPPKEDVDDDFWCDSESDFGADSDEDMIFGGLFFLPIFSSFF